jgi:hypothetical protein
MKKIILIILLACSKSYSNEVKFYGLLDVDNVNYDNSNMEKSSVIYQIIEKEKQLFREGAYLHPAR